MALNYMINSPLLLLSILLSLSFLSLSSHAINSTLTQGQTLKDGDYLVSSGELFELGFFSPSSSKNRYVGIWYYNFSTDTVLWVANRQNPIPDTSGSLTISKDGNLVVLDGSNTILWSSNVSVSSSNNSTIEIMDTGNLVLNNSGDVKWQSFDNPTDTYLPGMTVGLDLVTHVNHVFTSWKSDDDPAVGNYSIGMDPRESTEIVMWEGEKTRWRSGRWDGQVFLGIQYMVPLYIYGFKLNNFEQEKKMYFYYTAFNASHRYVLKVDGTEDHMVWKNDTQV